MPWDKFFWLNAWVKKKIIAETGAGQHGVATATAAALFNMECTIYMGEEDAQTPSPQCLPYGAFGSQG